jgi:hypothetical protein
MHEKKGRGSLRFTKDYEAICKEWLGGLKPLHYRAHILKDQLGRHFDSLQATGLIGRTPTLEKNKAGTGFNVTFHPGPGFYEDYQAYYLDKKPARLSMRTVAELQEVKALELVAYFHRRLGRIERTRFKDHETAYATELLSKHTEAEVRDLIDYAVAEAPRTNFEPLYFGAIKKFVAEWSENAARRKKRELRDAVVAACPHCAKDGWLELREQGTNRVFVHLCPHKLEHITMIEEEFNARRI